MTKNRKARAMRSFFRSWQIFGPYLPASENGQHIILRALDFRLSQEPDKKLFDRVDLPLIVENSYRTALVQTVLEFNVRVSRWLDKYDAWFEKEQQQKPYSGFFNAYQDHTVEPAVKTLEALISTMKADPNISQVRLKRLARSKTLSHMRKSSLVTFWNVLCVLGDILYGIIKWATTGKFK